MYSSIYSLQSQSHFSVVKQINEVLKSNLQVLDEVTTSFNNEFKHFFF